MRKSSIFSIFVPMSIARKKANSSLISTECCLAFAYFLVVLVWCFLKSVAYIKNRGKKIKKVVWVCEETSTS